MKTFIVAALAFSSVSVYAQDGLFYRAGSLKGQAVTHSGFLGYEKACYRGNAWKARQVLVNFVNDDIEKSNTKVWYNQTTKEIELIFVDTKCTDEGQSDAECLSEVTIPKCKF